jgi:GNAT superfamily N-acetyltransferase
LVPHMFSDVLIRPAIVSERKTLESLQRRSSLSNAGDRMALLANPDVIELPAEQIAAGQVFVLEQGDAIVAFAAIVPRDDGDTELEALFVEPSMSRRGIGRLLIEHCAEVARSGGSTALRVVGNPHAERFYLACGFQMVGTAETHFGVGLLLQKSLQTAPAPKGR